MDKPKELIVTDVKVFAPAKDFPLSLSFYQALGWKTNWSDGKYAELELGGHRFFLQNYYQKGWANNFMFYINVEDLQSWYEHTSRVINNGNYGKARIKPPAKQAHGDIVSHVWDPTGILLHFAETVKN